MIPSNNNNNNIPTMEGLAAVLSNQKQNDIPTYDDIRDMPKYTMFVGEKSNIKPMPNPMSTADFIIDSLKQGWIGQSDKDIWNKYGYYPKEFNDQKNGVYELDDSKATINQKILNSKTNGMPLNEALPHPTLYKAYPQLKNIKVNTSSDPRELDNGYYSPDKNEIYLNTYKPTKDNVDRQKKVLLHEIQHAIQDIEDKALSIPFKRLENYDRIRSDDADVVYLTNPDEIDAFSTSNRANMSAAQRQHIAPALMTDEGRSIMEGRHPLLDKFYNSRSTKERQQIFTKIHAMP